MRHARTHNAVLPRVVVSGFLAFSVLAAQALGKERDVDAAKKAALGHSEDMVEDTPLSETWPDFTTGLVFSKKDRKPIWMMGPTGIIGMKNQGNAGNQVRVISVTPESPADGKVLPGDVLLGVNDRMFQLGGNINLLAGNAIINAETEAGKGILKLHLWRDRNWVKRTAKKDVFGIDIDEMFKEAESGNANIYEWLDEEERTVAVKQMAFDEFPIDGVTLEVTLQLEVMGTYSDSSPWDCPVVQKVRDNALKVIAARITPSKRKRGKLGGDWPDVLALVASGKPEYVALAKKWVHEQKLCQDMNYPASLKDVTYRGMQSWFYGFGPLEMAIYYDATGDEYVLPEIRKRAIIAALGQNGGGSWGHTFAFRYFNGGMLHKCNPGYGAMNNAGGRCFFLLTLAKKAGIDHPEINAAIWRASRFFSTFVDKGCIPYGYHSPYPSDDSNGKNYGPAYAFYVLGERYKSKFFSMHSAHASFSRRGGHASPTLWYYTPLSAHMSGPEAVKAYMRNMRYFYTLSRRHDGAFIFLGEQLPGVGGAGMRNATATVAMHLSAPLEQLIITGKGADKKGWMTDEELNELLISARGSVEGGGQIKDPVLLKKIGKPWKERGTDELLDLLDHFYPNMRKAIAEELGKRYAAGETDIVRQVTERLEDNEARMRAGACLALLACGKDVALSRLSTVVAMLKDEAEFVRTTAASTIGKVTEPGDSKREIALLKAAVDEYDGMTMDNGNLRNAIASVVFQRKRRGQSKSPATLLTSKPFQAGYDEELVRAAMETIVTMDPQGRVPGSWDRETLLKLAGPVTFAASERQMNDAMFGGARKEQGQALLRKFGYREAVEGDAFNLIQRSRLERSRRRGVKYKDAFITPKLVKRNPGLYRAFLDDLYLWQQDDPNHMLSEKTAKGKPPLLTPINRLIEIIENDTDKTLQPSVLQDVSKMFQSELAATGSSAEWIKRCRKELANVERKNYFRKMCAMTVLARMLGVDAIDDVSPYLGHEHWRLREHASKVVLGLVEEGAGDRLLTILHQVQAQQSGLLGNWNAAGILATLADAGHVPALSVAKVLLAHKDPVVRAAAIQTVFGIGGDAELNTVFAFMRSARALEDFDGCEKAILSRKDDPAYVQRVSKAVITLLPRSEAPLRRSLAWVLGQFGGADNLAAIENAAATTEDDGDMEQMVLALAYSPDRGANDNMVSLLKVSDRCRDVVSLLAIHRMVGRNGMGDVTDEERVKFAREILNYQYRDSLVEFLGCVHTAPSMQLLYDVMMMKPATAAKSIIECAEGISRPSAKDAKTASDVLVEVIEYIEVTYLRGGINKQIKERSGDKYIVWRGMQSRAGQALLKFNKPGQAPIPQFDDMELDL